MERDGVVNLRADLARGEKLAQFVAAVAADDVLVPDVPAARNLVGQHDAVAGIRPGLRQSSRCEQRVVALGHGAPGLVPAVDVLELDREDGAL